MTHRLKYVYVLFLLIAVSLLVLIVQGVYRQETTNSKPIEFTRIDGYNETAGKISNISIRIKNDDPINHNYSIQAQVDSVNISNENVEIGPSRLFTYSIQIPTEKKFINNTILNESIKKISLKVYRDNRSEPLDQIEFTYNR